MIQTTSRHSKKRTLMWSSYIYWKKVYMSACDYSGGKVSNTSCGNQLLPQRTYKVSLGGLVYWESAQQTASKIDADTGSQPEGYLPLQLLLLLLLCASLTTLKESQYLFVIFGQLGKTSNYRVWGSLVSLLRLERRCRWFKSSYSDQLVNDKESIG